MGCSRSGGAAYGGSVVDRPLVCVLVLNWRQSDATLALLADLSVCEDSPGADGAVEFEHRVLVMDNGSGDDSVKRLEGAAGVDEFLAFDTNRGYCAAMNEGVRWALAQEAKYVLFLNNDLRVDSSFLGPLVDVLEHDPRVACVGPTVLETSGRVWCEGGRLGNSANLVSLIRQGQMPRSQTHGPEAVDFIPGACALYRASLFDEIGLLDESYFMYVEEVEFSYRIRDRGYRIVWLPWVRVVHDASRSTGGGRSPLRKFMVALNSVRYLKAHGTLALWLAFLVYDVLLWPLTLVTATGPRAACAKLRGTFKGLFGGRVTAADVAHYTARTSALDNCSSSPPNP